MMISLVDIILNEGSDIVPYADNVPEIRTTVDVDLNNFKQVLADALNIDESKIEVGIVPAKCQDPNQPALAIMDRMDPGKTGDIWAKFDAKDTDSVARTLNGFNVLEDIEINGQSGAELSGIVSDGTQLAGNLVITSKETESELIPFLRAVGVIEQRNDDGGFEDYWRKIGGKIIGEATIQRMQQSMRALADIRGGRQIGGRAMRALPGIGR